MATSTTKITESDIDKLPNTEAVYAIYAEDKDTLKPINCRYVGETDDIQRRTGEHFDESEENECLKEFMQSNKTKILVYELMPGSDDDERLEAESAWIASKKPKCNKKK